jgi:hypothetical protein
MMRVSFDAVKGGKLKEMWVVRHTTRGLPSGIVPPGRPLTRRKEAGAAKGSAAAEQDGADGTARKAQKIKQRDLSKRTIFDPSDPRPKTAYSLFVEERKHELQRQREHLGQPQASKGELQKATSEEWKAQDHATRRRELEAQHKAAMGEWSKRQKLLQPAQVSPATTAGTSPMRRSQFFAGVTPEEVD